MITTIEILGRTFDVHFRAAIINKPVPQRNPSLDDPGAPGEPGEYEPHSFVLKDPDEPRLELPMPDWLVNMIDDHVQANCYDLMEANAEPEDDSYLADDEADFESATSGEGE